MTFKEAFKIAMKNPTFIAHHARVIEAQARFKANPNVYVEKTGCLVFVVDGEWFYYGFDGCKVARGKYGQLKSAWLAERGIGLTIRNPVFD